MNRTCKQVKFGIVLLPNFTLTAFSGFIDVLRLCGDDGDRSEPVRCAWTVVSDTLAPIRASCGVQVQPWRTFDDADAFDYVVAIGGLLHSGSTVSDAGLRFIRRSAESSATVVGVCTGAFALAQAGVMEGHRICVSWFHYWDFLSWFPGISEALLVVDRLFVIDGRRITCSGGRASIDVAAAILLQHIDAAVVQKALRILLVDEARCADAPQPHPPGSEPMIHPRLRRAVHLIEQHIGALLSVEALATRLDTSPRQLQRLFKEETGESPLAYALRIRLKTAAWLLAGTHRTTTDIAGHCGFFDASHMGRQFRRVYGVTPQMYRVKHHAESSTV
ncbi:GlxA family transcriptional regulator [Caballeronia sp. GAFFF1]|uniref:GlxA family transcriptional regulator n=1 Tax=Caballeronia sp. GAFFF1 TaxID=2921779 RepID=UPI0032EF3E18